jgi:hypothetical protein
MPKKQQMIKKLLINYQAKTIKHLDIIPIKFKYLILLILQKK